MLKQVDLAVVHPFPETIPCVEGSSLDYGVNGHSPANAGILVNMIIRNHNGESKLTGHGWPRPRGGGWPVFNLNPKPQVS